MAIRPPMRWPRSSSARGPRPWPASGRTRCPRCLHRRRGPAPCVSLLSPAEAVYGPVAARRVVVGRAASGRSSSAGGLLAGGPRRGSGRVHHLVEVAQHHRRHGRDRDGEERAGDAEQRRAQGDREQHHGGVQVHRLRLQPRGEHVALELLHRHDQGQHDQRTGQTVGDQGDQHRDGAGHERTHDRDEAGEEGQHRERDRQRHADEQQPDADEAPRRSGRPAPGCG